MLNINENNFFNDNFLLFPEFPVPLQFTTYLGILAGIVLTLLIIILAFVLVISINTGKGAPEIASIVIVSLR